MSDITSDLQTAEINQQPPRIYKLIALRGIVAFPHQTLHFDISRDKSLHALNKAAESEQDILLVAQKHAQMTNPTPKDLYKVGTICKIKQIMRLSNDNVRVFVKGIERVTIDSYVSIYPYFEVSVSPTEGVVKDPISFEALKRQCVDFYDEYIKIDTRNTVEGVSGLNPQESEKFVNVIAGNLFKSDVAKQRILEEFVMEKRLELVCVFLATEAEILRTEKRINAKVRKQMDKNQREYYLREQMKAISDELGDGEDEIEALRSRAESLKLPEEAFAKVDKELKRLIKMASTSPEAAVIRSYIDWILDIPWHKTTTDNKDLVRAQRILDEDHFGLEKVKERIIEFLAVHQLTKNLKGPILCFVGPPGVGKTSIVKSIARTLDRKFISMSLGGVRDEAEIRGHRRTYIGAIPGRIITQMKHAGTINPLFLFDEIDKMSSDYKGDPASAMLEVLDPEQNFQFRDHYMELPYDLSKVMFITTANSVESIPAPLLDRMEVIELSGYTQEEKIEIAKKYLLPKSLKAHGLNEDTVSLSDEAVSAIITSYTRESGVRNLERELNSLTRRVVKKIVSSDDKVGKKGYKLPSELKFEITENDLYEYLGVAKYSKDNSIKEDLLGSAIGLAWTSVGGKTMTIEVVKTQGKGEIVLTGNLGDVMKESCRTALTLIKSRAEQFNIPQEVFSSSDIHVHVPEGATPKDGPSAGITIATAIMSALSGKLVSKNIAMTGELTLRGKVLAIGGLKEKALAAYRAGITNIIIPKDNYKDYMEIPQSVRDNLNLILADSIDCVLNSAIIQ